MATNFSRVLGVLCFKAIPNILMIGIEILSISQWSDTGPSWLSCLLKVGLIAHFLVDFINMNMNW